MKHSVFLFTLLFFVFPKPKAEAQNNIGFNFIFMTWHPDGDDMAFLQPRKLDPEAKFVLNWGGVVHYEHFIFKKRLSIKIAQGAYSDCAKLFAGHTHIALRLSILNSEKHFLRFGFGPTWVYRQSWYRFPGYEQQNQYLKTKGDWQYAFVWYGGEIEYDYQINRNWSLGLHIIPGLPDFFTFGIGFRYWQRPIPKNRYWRDNPETKKWFYSQKDLKAPF